MEPYNVIDDEDQPRTAEERAAMVSHSVAMIERMNAAIARHVATDIPNQLAIDQFAELRERYITELRELLQPIGVAVQWNADQRRAA
ncbi:hypothetical protein [Spirosoma rhododendri]|uniref:Uncharacterized protein n=1 Tax=Spirosoma rhododendri TaxID=2728024 RepID=A0A7L5DH36_9BACT|nr:hypothetical protein [Spirosoma rhododendri]QJD77614.1 hypothetical protein HH216_03675 [Spirosoma rhododendri]